MTGRAALALALSASLLMASGSAHAASDEEKAAARALATQGAGALSNGKYAEALDLVSRAQAIIQAPTHLLLIARAQVGLGKLVSAQETYLKLMRLVLPASAPAAFKNAQSTAKEELAAIEPKIASLRIVLEGVGQKKVTVKMDEQIVSPALLGVHRPVDPGKHEIVAFPVGQSPVKGSVNLNDGEKKEIKLVIPDGPPPGGVPLNPADNPDAGKTPGSPPTAGQGGSKFMTPMRGAGIGVGVAGVAGVVVGAIFMAKSGSTQSQADDAASAYGCTKDGAVCPPPKTAAQKTAVDRFTALDKDAASQKTIGVIGLAAGGVALAGGVVLIILGKPKPAAAPEKTASVEPWFDGTSFGLRGRF